MVIHHDKGAYGRLQKLSSDLSEEEMLKLIAEFNGQEGAIPPAEDKKPATPRRKRPKKD